MKSVCRLAIVDPNDATRAALKHLLLGIDMVWLEAECSRYEFFTDVVMQTQPDIALIAIDSEPNQGLAIVARVTQELPTCSVLVVSSSNEGSIILQAMRNGAKEFLNYPLRLEDFLAALHRILQLHGLREGETEVRSSQIYTIAGAAGGVGCTSLAVNLACILAQNHHNSVAVIDLDLSLGDADVWLDIIPDYTIQDVAENITRLDYALLKRSLTKHECGAFLLPRPIHLEESTPITPDELRRVIALLKATFSHLIIDVTKNYGPLELAAMGASDLVLMVAQLDLPGLRNVVRLLQFFDRHEGIPEKTRVVINRLGLEETQISLAKAVETIGREIFWQLPNEYSTMVESRNNGIPLITQAPKSKLTRSIQQLAQAIDKSSATGESAEEPKKGKSLFRFLSSGSSK
jgi:pilus assembly protein CpaE